jgi:hypothetical protein
MRTTKALRFLGKVSTRGEGAGHLNSPGDAVLVERGRPRLLLLSCPCGCGEPLPINLDPRSGPAWRLYTGRGKGLTLFPSVWRESGCNSHFIIWRDKILLFGRNEDEFDDSVQDERGLPPPEVVRQRLPITGLVSFSEIAEVLDAVPWDVLRVCHSLVRRGLAREGKGQQRGHFGRA